MAAICFVALREDYPLKVYTALVLNQPVALVSDPYRGKIAEHKAYLAQAKRQGTLRYGFVGDSIIADWLVAANFDHSINLGIRGDTASNLLTRLDVRDVSVAPIWYVGIGVNDLARGEDADEIITNLVNIFSVFEPVETVFWRAILPVSSSYWSVEKEAARVEVNQTMRGLCEKAANCVFLQVPAAFRIDIRQVTTDGLHPNAVGYEVLAQQFCAYVSCALGRGKRE